ncbi:TetR/AcrR family transcriptional regulator [Listeria monocytogenes]|uniref:TetR/AcrR family transcriptional regulator n=1 Tax=Listeria monocytogenes TaxID=1639 RepID=UPI0011EAD0FC|nr:TetR/AcrR family transcriptional regulator [Listeria monocytogenes]TYU82736.1 TetR/AcrR family transcriptional regulator [Listeria monocytogenes]
MNRAEKSLITKNKIFDIAVKFFNERGYYNTTISQICKEANVAKGTFYVHYVSKEAIIKESYYLNLTQYIEENYKLFESKYPTKAIHDKILYFLNLELAFAKKVGLEITTLAFSFNMAESLEQNNAHFQKRTFSSILKNLIENSKIENSEYSTEYVFLVFESLVRGIMATWCFSEGSFDIIQDGQRMLTDTVNAYIK